MKVFLDSNVILSTLPRLLFIEASWAGHVELWFSKSVEDECKHVAERKGLVADVYAAFVELHLYGHFQTGFEEDDSFWLPDEHDRHVALSARAAKCEVIATENLRDFPKAALEPIGLNAQNPDQLLYPLALKGDLDISKQDAGELKRAKLYRLAKLIK